MLKEIGGMLLDAFELPEPFGRNVCSVALGLSIAIPYFLTGCMIITMVISLVLRPPM